MALKAESHLDDSQFMASLRRMSHGVEELHEKMEETEPGRRLLESLTALGIYGAARSVMEFGAQLKNNAAMTDLNVEAFQKLGFAFGATGTEQEMFSRGMQTLQARMGEAEDSEKVTKAFAEVGRFIADLKEHAGDTDFAVRRMADGIKNADEPAKALAASLELLVAEEKSMQAGLKEGSEGLDELSSKITVLTETEVEELHRANHAFEEFWRETKVAAFHGYKKVEGLSDWMGAHNIWGDGGKTAEHPHDVWNNMRKELGIEEGGGKEKSSQLRDDALAQAEDARLAKEYVKIREADDKEEARQHLENLKAVAAAELNYFKWRAKQDELAEKEADDFKRRIAEEYERDEYERAEAAHQAKLKGLGDMLSKVQAMNDNARANEQAANRGLLHNQLTAPDQLRQEIRDQQREDRAQRHIDSMARDREAHPERNIHSTRRGENQLFKDLKGAKDAVKLTQDTINSLSKALAKEMEVIITKP